MNEQELLFVKKNEYLSTFFEATDTFSFYRDIFPEGSFEKKGQYEDNKANGIVVSVDENHCARRCTITDDLDVLQELKGLPFVILSPIGYWGKARNGDNARFLYAVTVDLDGVEMKHLENILYQIDNELLPKPTYLVNSGNGIHLYYVLEKPVAMYKQVQKRLKDFKYAFIRRIWNKYTSNLIEPQMQGILQGFRMVGSQTKLGENYVVTAYKIGEKVSFEYLNAWVPEENEMREFSYKSDLTLDEAKQKYPDWYKKRILEGKKKGRWVIKRDLYDWWYKTIQGEKTLNRGGWNGLYNVPAAEVGHRYFCVMALAIYAKKCDIDYEELERDALNLVTKFDREEDRFTEDDVMSALEIYNENYVTFPRDDIEKLTAIPIKVNKRNGRKQSLHLRLARANRDILCEERGKKDWREGAGRPKGSGTAEQRVKQWRQENPTGRKVECHRDTGLDPKTIRKWW